MSDDPYAGKILLSVRSKIKRILDSEEEWSEFLSHAIENPIPERSPIREEIVTDIKNYVGIKNRSPTEKMLSELGMLGYRQSDLLHWANIDGRFKQIADLIENRGKSLPNTPTGDQETFKATNRELQRLHSYTTSAPGKFPKRFSIEEAGSENEIVSDNEKPSLLDLQFVVESTAISKSNGICRRLGVSEAVLNQAEMTYPLAASSASLDRFMYALKDWHDGNGVLDGKPVPVTYNLLCTALEESRCREVSDDLRKRQCIGEDRRTVYQRRRTEEIQCSTPSKLFKPNEDSKVTTEKGPKEIQTFLEDIREVMLNYCDVREISNELRKDNIISASQYDTLKASISRDLANQALYDILYADPSERKLKATAEALDRCTCHDNNQGMADKINRFLSNHSYK